MFKNGITLLVIAAAAASCVSAEAALDKAHSIPSNPVVKKVSRSHGKISLTLEDGTVIHTKEHVHASKVKKVQGKESEGVVDGEVIRKYKHGVVKIASKKQPVQSVQQKVVKKVAPTYKQVEAEGEEDETPEAGEEDETPEGQGEEGETPEVQGEQDETSEGQSAEGSAYGVAVDEVDDEESHAEGSEESHGSVEGGEVAGSTHDSADVDLESGESVSLTFGNHNVTLTLLQNGTLELEADDTVQYLPAADDITVEFDGSADFEDSEEGTDVKHKKIAAKVVDKKKAGVVGNQKVVQNEVKDNKKKEVGIVEGIENKVTEFVTQLRGDSEYFTKKSTPFLIGCGLVGALAIVIGIAAVAVGRARDNAAAAADPQSVLAENEEDEDLEAANSTVDATADDSESLSDAEGEEGKFANEAVVVSV